MKKYALIILCSTFLFNCGQISKKTNSINENEPVIKTSDSIEINELEQSQYIDSNFREESLETEFTNVKMYDLSEVMEEDFDGDTFNDKAEFQKANGKAGIRITSGKTQETVTIGLGNKLGEIGDDFSWIDYWGVVKDSTTYEILFENDEISGDTIVKLENPSIVVRKDEVGGGVITFKNGEYIWIHQAD